MKAVAFLTSLALTSFTMADMEHFDKEASGAAPKGWTTAVTGDGDSKWTVEKDSTAPSPSNVLKQAGEGTFPIILKNNSSLKDGFVEVKFKPVSGREDQAGGVIWRAQDKDNYYIARANALEDNVTIYYTIKGRRVSFKSISAKVTSGAWHTLRVGFNGNKFTVTFDGQKVIEASDDSFSAAGKVGLWTKAHSVTLFDDFSFGTNR